MRELLTESACKGGQVWQLRFGADKDYLDVVKAEDRLQLLKLLTCIQRTSTRALDGSID